MKVAGTVRRCAAGAALAAALGLGLDPAAAEAATPACDARIRLHPSGLVEVGGEFSGLPVDLATLELFSGTKDAGVLSLPVKDGRARFSYSSAHQLHREADGLYLGSPDFYVPGARLDLTLSVQFPPMFKLLDAQPAPADKGLGNLRWEERGVSHFVAVLQFAWRGAGLPEALKEEAADATPGAEPATLNGSTPTPGDEADGGEAKDAASGSDSESPGALLPPGKLFDPAELPTLRPGEEAQSAQQLLEELAFAIKLARAEGQCDPGFLNALEKFLAKLYTFFQEHEQGPDDSIPPSDGGHSRHHSNRQRRIA